MSVLGKARRELTLGGPTCLLGDSGREFVQSGVFDTSTLQPGGTSEVQTVTLTGSPGGGTFTLAYKGQVTTALAYNATAATVQAALRLLSRIGPTGVTVTGSAGGPYTLTFGGKLANLDVESLVGNGAALTGGTTPAVSVAETTKGSSTNAGLYVIESGLPLAVSADGKRVVEWTGAGNVNEVQTVTLSGSPGGGTFALIFEGERTSNIAYNATAATVQAALEALPNIAVGDVGVAGSAGGPYTVTFTGALGGQSVDLMEWESALTGGTAPTVTVAQTTQGATVQELVGFFDGRREYLNAQGDGDNTSIPIYNDLCAFDRAVVKNWATNRAVYEAWAIKNNCVFRSQGDA